MTTDFDHILNWELKSGSHDFPGPDGGTCINEAAIVAAGFEYKSVSSAHDCPPCFSRPLSSFALMLNDSMPNDLRNKLLKPFVTRLAGTADTPEIERERMTFMIVQIARRMVAPALEGLAPPSLVARWKACETLEDVQACARARALDLALDLARALDLALDLDLARALDLALARALDLARARALDKFWGEAVAILDGAMAIGRQAEPLDTALVLERMDQIRVRAAERVGAPV